MNFRNFHQLAALVGLILANGPATADQRTSTEYPISVIGNSHIKLVDFKDEVTKLKKRLHIDTNKSPDSDNSGVVGKSDQQTPGITTQATCRPGNDVAVEVTHDKCMQGYKSSDFATRFINKTSKHASVQIEFESHSGGTGALITRKQMFDFQGNSKETSYLCATRAQITKCIFD